MTAGAADDALTLGRRLAERADAAACRHLQQAVADLGPPPAACVWLAAGSQGRGEQSAGSDQDNALIYADDAPAAAESYFAELTARVCDGLNADGYVYCPGEMMANNRRWRQPLRVWRGYFADWIADPEPMALMLASVLFDLRPVWGAKALFDALRPAVLAQARDNRIFLGHFADNALARRPPLGFFGRLRPFSYGPHAGTLDLKHDGLIPVVDMARLYGLAAGIPAVNTVERLAAAAAAGVVSPAGAARLTAAYQVIANLRLAHQAAQQRAGMAVDSFVPLAELTGADQQRLRDAFAVVRDMQTAVAHAFPLTHF